MIPQPHFKICPNCRFTWQNRKDFLGDETLTIIGYQANFKNLHAGILLFNHTCRGTLALPVSCFEDLYIGPRFQKRMAGSDTCPGYCFHRSRLNPCPNECECAFVRKIISLLKERPPQPRLQQKV